MAFSTHSLAFSNSLMISGFLAETKGCGGGSGDAISFGEEKIGGG
jgi:hypothetical protein